MTHPARGARFWHSGSAAAIATGGFTATPNGRPTTGAARVSVRRCGPSSDPTARASGSFGLSRALVPRQSGAADSIGKQRFTFPEPRTPVPPSGWLGLREAKPRSLGRRTSRGVVPIPSGLLHSQPEEGEDSPQRRRERGENSARAISNGRSWARVSAQYHLASRQDAAPHIHDFASLRSGRLCGNEYAGLNQPLRHLPGRHGRCGAHGGHRRLIRGAASIRPSTRARGL